MLNSDTTAILMPTVEECPPAEPQPASWPRWIVRSFEDHRLTAATCLLSMLFHMLLLIVLGMIILPPDAVEELLCLTVSTVAEDDDAGKELEIVAPPEVVEAPPVDPSPMEIVGDAVAQPSAPIELGVAFRGPALSIDLSSDFGGRSQAARAAMLKQFGGTEESEAAVALGLQWLARHQNDDGSWCFNYVQNNRCKTVCWRPGTLENKTGATGMALLSFLGAGHTHEQGEYKQVVRKGIDFLLKSIVAHPDGGDLRGGEEGYGMYTQGLATIAICEAHAMTNDLRLKRASLHTIQFIINAQDHSGGGWRYKPRERGDTSVLGWQLMALRSAQSAHLPVPRHVLLLASSFLDYVQANGGAQYGYLVSERSRPGTTAVGLLCRMYLGWRREHEGLRRGVAYLASVGPSVSRHLRHGAGKRRIDPYDMYYNYYATQVMHHWGGREWKKWNAVMRDALVHSQVKQGCAEGSWHPNHRWEQTGGRLFTTCLCIMTLEVYYRHLPLYQRETISPEM